MSRETTEIERRFRVKTDGWKAFTDRESCESIIQGYLSRKEQDFVVRVRLSIYPDRESANLTIKTPKEGGFSRNEFEYPIPVEDCKHLLAHTSKIVYKTRFHLNISDADWVVDIFSGKNDGLILAEAEIPSETYPLKIPDWCGEEVTDMKNLSNASLALANGYESGN